MRLMSAFVPLLGDKRTSNGSASHLRFYTVLLRVASMASGSMDTLPHHGAVITLLAVTGLTHRQSYGDIFVLTAIKTTAVFIVVAAFYLTGII